MTVNGVVTVKIETAIRQQSWATAQVGQKSLQTIIVDFSNRTISGSYVTGNTHIGCLTLESIRNDFQLNNYRFPTDNSATFSVKGQTASGVGFMPDIDYALDILLNRSPKLITVTGNHDGYPSYNVSVNGSSVYDYVQGHSGQLLGKSDIMVMRKSVEWK